MRSDLVPGSRFFPTFSCPITPTHHAGSSELQGDDPLILDKLARGHYCPKEHQQEHLELAAFYPKIKLWHTPRLSRSPPTTITLCRSSARRWVPSGPSSPDPEQNFVQKDLDIAEYTDPEHNPMIPHTLVLKPGLIIHSVYNGYWFWGPALCHRPLARFAGRDARDPP